VGNSACHPARAQVVGRRGRRQQRPARRSTPALAPPRPTGFRAATVQAAGGAGAAPPRFTLWHELELSKPGSRPSLCPKFPRANATAALAARWPGAAQPFAFLQSYQWHGSHCYVSAGRPGWTAVQASCARGLVCRAASRAAARPANPMQGEARHRKDCALANDARTNLQQTPAQMLLFIQPDSNSTMEADVAAALNASDPAAAYCSLLGGRRAGGGAGSG
jgi:hypothetical protein